MRRLAPIALAVALGGAAAFVLFYSEEVERAVCEQCV